MRQIFVSALFVALLVCAHTIPVPDTSADMSLENSNELPDSISAEHYLPDLDEAHIVSDDDLSQINSGELREKRLVVDIVQHDDDDSHSHDEEQDKTLLKGSSKLVGGAREKRSTEDSNSESKEQEEATKTDKRNADKNKSKSSEESQEHEGHGADCGHKHAKHEHDNAVRRKRALDTTEEDSSEEQKHPIHARKWKRDASSDSTSEEKDKQKDNQTSEESDEHKAKKTDAENKIQARRRRQLEDTAAELVDDDEDDTEVDDLASAEALEPRKSSDDKQQQKYAHADESVVVVEPDTLDYVQGCEVMEANSYEANETTYYNEKR